MEQEASAAEDNGWRKAGALLRASLDEQPWLGLGLALGAGLLLARREHMRLVAPILAGGLRTLFSSGQAAAGSHAQEE